ncbi:hypothetical protein [Thalassoglobus sp.]|uniref:hypothetical protein n=1 Tax=Thalassoglobus sp. TaxID=2795869 RepID=UPI003AA8D311
MLYYKALSLVLICTGGVSLLNGVSPQVIAGVQCQGGQVFDGTICDPAHARQMHMVISANMRCEDDSSGTNCHPTERSQCGTLEGYQFAVRGMCVTTMESSDEFGCQENSGATFVPVDYYSSTCKYKDGACVCMLIGSTVHPTQYSEQCSCSQ